MTTLSLPTIAKRAQKFQASPLRKLAASAETRKKAGVKVYHLNIGQPDLPTNPAVFKALRSFKESTLAYAPSNGINEALEAWSTYYKSQNIKLAANELVITTGGSEAIIFALETVCDPNDEVLVFEPFYTNYNTFAAEANVKLVPVTLDIKAGFHLPTDKQIKQAISKRTKAILICNPSNPTGTIFSKPELQRLVNLAKQYGLFILSDEAYREFAFERKAYSIMEFPEIRQQAILLDSASKRFNVCGARIGILGSKNKAVITATVKMAMARLSVATIEQLAIIPLLKQAAKYTKPIVTEFRKRREVVIRELNKIPNITFSKPEGAFYIVIGLPVKDADEFARWLIEEFEYHNETVLLAPAAGFYATPGKGVSEVRLAFMLNCADLRKALTILRIALEAYCK
ncbi:MAG: pyridoxal phosphate-dependent aminotransferase [Patescibacteria group bacterium]|jgi:aspartate aminotransferase